MTVFFGGMIVEQFDCIIIGNNVSSLVSALFLARKMRRILVFHDRTITQPKKYQITMKPTENQTLTMQYPLTSPIPGLLKDGLTQKLLASVGMEKDIKAVECPIDMIVHPDGVLRKRMNRLEQFQVYLIRYYPKQRDHIIRFFEDGARFSQNYLKQQENMLLNNEYTISSFMIEWGDYSVKELLEKYFTDPELIREFSLHPAISGLPLDTLHSYHFFVSFFLQLSEGNTYWLETEGTLMKKIIAKIQLVHPKAIMSQKIQSFQVDSKNRIESVTDDQGNEYHAKYYLIGDYLPHVIKQYFKDNDFSSVLPFFPGLNQPYYQQSIMILLKQPLQTIDLEEYSYQFMPVENSTWQLTRMVDVRLTEPSLIPNKQGILQIDYVYSHDTIVDLNDVFHRLYEHFPKLEKLVLSYQVGTPSPKMGNLPPSELRKGRSINEQIAIENGEHARLFENLYTCGSWLRPEAGNYNVIQAGILYGDAVEELLYYGDDEDDSFYYLTNDEIMMMLKHNFKKAALGPKEHHVNFQVGKSSYFIRTKANVVTIHRGLYPRADLTIYTTNDTLANLLLKKTTFDDALKSGSLRYSGEEAFLYDVVNGFVMDDYKVYEPIPKPKFKLYFLGVKFLFVYFGVWALMAFLANYLDMIWITPFAFVLTGMMVFLRWKLFHKIHWFEYTLLGLMVIFLFASIFIPSFNQSRNDDYFLASMGVLLFVTGMIDKGVVWAFHRYDYQPDYANSSLFKVITNGLTLIWAFLFLTILGLTYVTGNRYVSANYYLIFLGFFLTYYYPILYVKTNIKK